MSYLTNRLDDYGVRNKIIEFFSTIDYEKKLPYELHYTFEAKCIALALRINGVFSNDGFERAKDKHGWYKDIGYTQYVLREKELIEEELRSAKHYFDEEIMKELLDVVNKSWRYRLGIYD